MKKQFLQKFSTSFLLWFDNFLLKNGETYETKDVEFINNGIDPVFSKLESFQSKYEQIVYDSSIQGAVVPIKIGEEKVSEFLPEWFNSAMIDFTKGRVLCEKGLITDKKIVVKCSPKEIAVGFSDMMEGEIVDKKIEDFLKKKQKNPKLRISPFVVLCVDKMENEPVAFGGLLNSTVFCKAIIFSPNNFLLDGVLSIFNDSRDEIFMEIPDNKSPLSEYGVLKSAKDYNYDLVSQESKLDNLKSFYINKVYCSKTNDSLIKDSTGDLYLGFVEFEISTNRYRGE